MPTLNKEEATIPSDFLAQILLFQGRSADLREAILRLKQDDYETILTRYSDREEWVHINALIVELHHVPLSKLLILAASPLAIISGLSSSLGMYHSFLWYARLCLVNACAAINPPLPFRFTSMYEEASSSGGTATDQLPPVSQRKQDEMLEICLFTKSALNDLIDKGAEEPLWYRATCSQIAFEIGNYYWLIDDYEMTLNMMDLALDLLNACGLGGENMNDCIWIDFELSRITNIKKVCCLKLQKYEPSLCSQLLTLLDKKSYQKDGRFLALLLADVWERKVSLAVKRTILQAIMKTDEENASSASLEFTPRLIAPQTSLIIAITYSLTVLTLGNDEDKLASFLSDKTSSKIGKIRRELLPNLDTRVLLDTLQEARQFIPLELLDEWLLTWHIISFVHVALSHKEDHQLFASHPFTHEFFTAHKQYLLGEEENVSKSKDRSLTCPSFEYFLREMLFTQINPGEEQHVKQLSSLVSQHGTLVVPHILKLAKKHVNTEPLIALELLVVCQNIPLDMYTQSGYSYEAFEQQLVTIQRDAVICGLVDKAQEFLNEGKNVSSILDQFFQTDDLANPSSLLLFSKTFNMMIMASELDAAILYATNVHNRIASTDPCLANAVLLLGKSLALLFQVEKNLIEQNVLATDGSLDLSAMNKLQNESAAQYCLFSLQLLNWVGHDLIHAPLAQMTSSQSPTDSQQLQVLQNDVFQEITRFLRRKERHPSMLFFFVGSFGGRLSKQLPNDKMMSLTLLGPACVFSIPFRGFSSQPGPLVEAPVEIKEPLGDLLRNLQHDSETMSPALMSSGLKILKLLLESRIKSLDTDQKRNGEYWLLGDVYFALNDHEGAIRAYTNEILVASQYGASLDLLKSYRTGTFFKRMAETLVSLNDFISAAFFLQFHLPSPPYREIFAYLSKSLPLISGTISKEQVVYDPPWKEDASPAFAFFDMHVIEFLISCLSSKPKDENIVKMLTARLKGPLFDPHDASVMNYFIRHLLNWYLVRICTKFS